MSTYIVKHFQKNVKGSDIEEADIPGRDLAPVKENAS